jgi:hypothetical protein
VYLVNCHRNSGPNLYAYTRGNPVNSVDPSGLKDCPPTSTSASGSGSGGCPPTPPPEPPLTGTRIPGGISPGLFGNISDPQGYGSSSSGGSAGSGGGGAVIGQVTETEWTSYPSGATSYTYSYSFFGDGLGAGLQFDADALVRALGTECDDPGGCITVTARRRQLAQNFANDNVPACTAQELSCRFEAYRSAQPGDVLPALRECRIQAEACAEAVASPPNSPLRPSIFGNNQTGGVVVVPRQGPPRYYPPGTYPGHP